MRNLFVIFSVVFSLGVFSQNQEFSLLFMGDVMGHQAQIDAAYDTNTQTYNYQNIFEKIAPLIRQSDVAIANLEVTLAGKPYKGYPQFSSPDALAVACKDNGIGVLVTANNHSVDRGKKGIIRTLDVLDSLELIHTGTFRSKEERQENNLLILENNGIKVGVLNYTYGTNGITVPSPTIVNLIDKEQMLLDIEKAKKTSIDKLIVMLHWGQEYKQLPNSNQKQLSQFLFDNGIDIIIGGHPHVVQPIEYTSSENPLKETFIAYSLGNFVSNQRATPKDGGIMVKIVLEKNPQGIVRIKDKGYYLTWVNKKQVEGKPYFEILSCSEYEEDNFKELDSLSVQKMKRYMENVRKLFSKENKNVFELKQKNQSFSTYYQQKLSLFRALPNTPNEIIFLGNSITDGGEWAELFDNQNIKNRGISGDTTFGVLNRLDEVVSFPSKIFLMIGISDLALGIDKDLILQNIEKIVDSIHEKSPKTKVYVESLLPVNSDFKKFPNHTSKTKEIQYINEKLEQWCNNTHSAEFIDLYTSFLEDKIDKLKPEYTNDGLHLTAKGYLHWKSLIEKFITERK